MRRHLPSTCTASAHELSLVNVFKRRLHNTMEHAAASNPITMQDAACCAGTRPEHCCPAPSACCCSVLSLGLAAHARAAILPEALHPPSCLLHRQGVSVHPVLPCVGQTTAAARLVRAGGHCAQHSSNMCRTVCRTGHMVLAGSWHVQECWKVSARRWHHMLVSWH